MNLADQFAMLWKEDAPPPDVFAFLGAHADVSPRQCADVLLIDQHHMATVSHIGNEPFTETWCY